MTHIEAEVVIIGAGVAGAITACKLACQGVKNILVLEAGPRIDRADTVLKFRRSPYIDSLSGFPNPAWAPRPDWSEADGADAQKPYIENIGPVIAREEYLRIVGGTTWHWDGITPRFLPVDFRLQSVYGVGADWPIDYDTLEPFYSEAEYELGVAGDDAKFDGSPRSKRFPMSPIPGTYGDKVIAGRMKDAGFPFASRPAARASVPYQGRAQCMGFGTCSPICPSGAQYGAIYHVERAEKLGVKVMENTRVDRIVANGSVTSIEARKPDGTPVSVRAKIFVLSANGIETPRLLLMSAGEKHREGIANSSGAVGKNFMEHPFLACRMTLGDVVVTGRGPQVVSASTIFRDGSFRSERPGFVLTTVNRSGVHEIANDLLARGAEASVIDDEIRKHTMRDVNFIISIEQLPDPANRITVNWDRRDAAGQPALRQFYSFSGYEKKGFAHAREAFGKIAIALSAEISPIGDPAPQNHLIGTTRMGDDPKTSVTDSFGRSHDHKNLFIVSSSLFPTAGTINPTLTIAALALRTAEEIARQLKNGG